MKTDRIINLAACALGLLLAAAMPGRAQTAPSIVPPPSARQLSGDWTAMQIAIGHVQEDLEKVLAEQRGNDAALATLAAARTSLACWEKTGKACPPPAPPIPPPAGK